MAKYKNLLLDVIVETDNEFVIEQYDKSDNYERVEAPKTTKKKAEAK